MPADPVATPVAVTAAPGWSPRHLICRHHNKIQLVGYEGGNLVLIAQQSHAFGTATYESAAAGAFLAGSCSICLFDPIRRPHLLLVGGLLLAMGGLFLVLAGYALTGGAVVLASLETARGGLRMLDGIEPERIGLVVLRAGARTLLLPYIRLVEAVCLRFGQFGMLVEERPFVVGTAIKLPLRLEFILKKLFVGDWIGVGVGLSWMLLGDGGLMLNDERLKHRLLQPAATP